MVEGQKDGRKQEEEEQEQKTESAAGNESRSGIQLFHRFCFYLLVVVYVQGYITGYFCFIFFSSSFFADGFVWTYIFSDLFHSLFPSFYFFVSLCLLLLPGFCFVLTISWPRSADGSNRTGQLKLLFTLSRKLSNLGHKEAVVLVCSLS